MSGTLSRCRAEADRLAVLAELEILDTPREAEFDDIVELACRDFDVPIAAVSFVDGQRSWLKSFVGVDAAEVPRDLSFCTHAIRTPDIMVIEDTLGDERFVDHPLVIGEPHLRFYAGAPLRIEPIEPGGPAITIGTLCIVDREPRAFRAADTVRLRGLANVIEALLRARASVRKVAHLAREITEHAQRVERANRQLRQAERMARIGSWCLDLATNAVSWSEEVRVIHELPPGEELALDRALDFYPEHERPRIAELVGRAAATGEPYEFESDFVTAKGSKRRVHSIGEVEFVGGKPVALIGVFQDVTQRHTNEMLLKRAAATDPLTGLPNRASFEERLEQLTRDHGPSSPYALLLIDLDGFKAVNDTFGHHAGDEVLRVIGRKLQGETFRDLFVARLGGDEFVILVDDVITCGALARLVEAILTEVRHFVGDGDQGLAVTASVGAASSENIAAARSTLHDADLALYSAKRACRGTGRIFEQDDPICSAQMKAQRRLRAAS